MTPGGMRTFSGLETVTVRPPAVELERRSRGALPRTTSRARLSSRSPWKRGWRRRPSRVHSVKPTCPTSSGSAQRAPRGPSPPAKGEVAPLPRAQLAAEAPQQGVVEARPDLARVAQLARCRRGSPRAARRAPSRALRLGPPRDHELLALLALQLQPVARARRAIRRVGALGDDALPARARRRAPGAPRRCRCGAACSGSGPRNGSAERSARLRSRSGRPVRSVAVEVEEVEEVEDRPAPRCGTG